MPHFSDIHRAFDWALPGVATPPSLASTHSGAAPQVFIGAPAWGRREWVGQIYPQGSRPAEWLRHYTRSFDSIELNSTHYQIPSSQTVQRWTEQVPKDFRFCPKLPAAITHSRQGLADRETQLTWLRTLENWGPTLGPCFAQFPPSFSTSEAALLRPLLEGWPGDFKLSLEFRHPSWFDSATRQVQSRLADRLALRRIGLVITDVAGRRDVLHTTASSPWVMIRFIGNEHDETDLARAERWSERLQDFARSGAEEIYFFLHQPDDLCTVQSADRLLPLLLKSGLHFGRQKMALVEKQLGLLNI